MEKYISPTNNKIFIPKENEWFNISTNRFVKNKNKNRIYIDKYRICYNKNDEEKYEKFLELNKKEDDEKNDYNCLSCKPIKNKNLVHTNDIEKVDKNTLDSILKYSYEGIISKIYISKIIDGDTYDMIFYVEFPKCNLDRRMLVNVPKKHWWSRKKKNNADGYFVKETCRLYGVDTAEKNTDEGKWIRDRAIEICKEHENIFYAKMYERDKYGRVLADFYFRLDDVDKRELSFNELLITIKDDDGNTVALPYTGGKKEPEKFGH